MKHTLSKTAAAFAFWSVSCGLALSQVAKPDNHSTGPSGASLMSDLSSWFSNHQGAGIAFVIGGAVIIGMTIYNRMYPNKTK